MGNTRIGFSTTNSWLSRTIRRVTRSECSHVWFLYYDLDFECDMVMEAHYTYQIIPFETFKRHNKIIDVITPKHNIDSAVKASVEWLGSFYDAAGLLGMVWVKLGRYTHHLWRNPFRSTKNVYCSEAVSRGLMVAKFPGLQIKDPETVGPDDLLRFFRRP